jgi:carboxyl-terminal processing protease
MALRPQLPDPLIPVDEPAPTLPVRPRRERLQPARLALVAIAILGGAALFLSGYTLGARTATTPGTPAGASALWAPFWDTYDAITQRYALGPVDPKTLVEGAIKGMVDSLGDPYSGYYGPAAYKQTLEGISGQFEGIGAEVGMTSTAAGQASCSQVAPTCKLVVIAPVPGAPAEKAGVRAGDVIERVDARPLTGMTVDQATALIRGPKGTTVMLTLVRGSGAPFDVTVTRDVIVQHEVTTRTLGGGKVGYIRITGFSDNAANDVVDALSSDLSAGEKAIVLDLRGDPGGFITAAEKVASQFIASGPIYWTEDAQGDQIATNAESGGIATDPSIRLVVLIDKGSASASEIVAGALQDTHRATLVGEQSFGKGTMQQWQPLENDTGGFKLTIAKWLTPDKRWIHHVGLTPDVAVGVPANAPPGSDPVLDRALTLLGAPDGSTSGPVPTRAPTTP